MTAGKPTPEKTHLPWPLTEAERRAIFLAVGADYGNLAETMSVIESIVADRLCDLSNRLAAVEAERDAALDDAAGGWNSVAESDQRALALRAQRRDAARDLRRIRKGIRTVVDLAAPGQLGPFRAHRAVIELRATLLRVEMDLLSLETDLAGPDGVQS